MKNLIKIDEAAKIPAEIKNQDVTKHNIMYLIQYGRIESVRSSDGVYVDRGDLEKYYLGDVGKRKKLWVEKYGEEINWHLSFEKLKETDTTKHVHRLHPYKGKFIPQLVEYFLDNKTDQFKKEIYFKKDGVVLDPFCGSGTAIIQANELGMHGIGIDVSRFNAMISRVKIIDVDYQKVAENLKNINKKLSLYKNQIVDDYVLRLDGLLSVFNKNLTAPVITRYSRELGLSKDVYIKNIFAEFYREYKKSAGVEKLVQAKILPEKSKNFIENWYFGNVRNEMNIVFDEIKKITDKNIKQIIAVILSRAIRSCRATTHSDLATLIYPQIEPYYCYKHNKICRPIMTIKQMFSRYGSDTIKRLQEFSKIKTDAKSVILEGDSRHINIFDEIKKRDDKFAAYLEEKKIDGIFSSPPYVGQIDYHEQHAYAYELFGLIRKDELEIGPLFKGQGKEARDSYVVGISEVLINCKKFLKSDYNIFLVANDKYGLYPEIAKKSGMQIVNQYKRPVLNRTEKNKNPYAEEIFHLKELK